MLYRPSFRTHERFELAPHRARERRYEENRRKRNVDGNGSEEERRKNGRRIERNAVRGEAKEAEIVKEREVCMLERA